MFFDTLWVKTKLKFSVPSAGLEMPSIFCSTQGPSWALELVAALIVCHGQASRTCGRCTFSPRKCSEADSAISTTEAIARRKISARIAVAALHLTHRGIHRRRRRYGGCGPPAVASGAQPPGWGATGPGQGCGGTSAGAAGPPSRTAAGLSGAQPREVSAPAQAAASGPAQAGSAAASLREPNQPSRRMSRRTIGFPCFCAWWRQLVSGWVVEAEDDRQRAEWAAEFGARLVRGVRLGDPGPAHARVLVGKALDGVRELHGRGVVQFQQAAPAKGREHIGQFQD